jgi:hypothetical protein
MLVRDKDSAEGYIHICDDSYKYTKQALKERLPIYLHDMKAYTLIESKDGYELIDIKYCPYCGAEIETDEYEK